MKSYFNCPANKVKQLQDLVKQYNLRWIFSPYPVLPYQPEGEWRVGIDFNNADSDTIHQFHAVWDRMNEPVKETWRKPSIWFRIKRSLEKSFPIQKKTGAVQ